MKKRREVIVRGNKRKRKEEKEKEEGEEREEIRGGGEWGSW